MYVSIGYLQDISRLFFLTVLDANLILFTVTVLPAFIKLLSEDDKEFNNAAYGIMLNLLLDKNNHPVFYKEQGIAR